VARCWKQSRSLRCVVVLALVTGLVSAVQLVVAHRASPALADATTGSAGVFVPTQGTVMDTRSGLGGVSGPVAANAWYAVPVAGQAGVPSSGVSSVQVSITVLTPAATGLVKLAPDGTTDVHIAALTYTGGGGSISASSIVALPADGKIGVLATTSVTVLMHVQGYYTAGNGSPAPGGYVPVGPTRIVDTRYGTGLPQAKLATGSTTAIPVGGLAGVPSDASAVFVMLTAITSSSTGGYFSPYPTGATRPANVSLNYLPASSTIAGAAVDLGTGGQFNLWIGTVGSSIDVIVDVVGYYTATPGAGAAFTPASTRVYDSRVAPEVALPANSSRTVAVGGVAGVPLPADGVAAYAVSAQIVHTGSGTGYLTVAPSDQPASGVSAVFFSAGSNVCSDLVVTPTAADGTVTLVNVSPDPLDVILDVEGWYSDAPGPKPNDANASPSDHGTTLTQTESDPSSSGGSTTPAPSGVFTNPSGQPVANLQVMISVPETAATDGTDSARTVLGTVTTDAQGAWSYTPPAVLPANVQAVADANMGVLNLEATTMGTAPNGTVLSAIANVPVGVPTSSGMTGEATDTNQTAVPTTMALHVNPSSSTTAAPPSDAAAAQSDASVAQAQGVEYHPPLWQSNNGPSSSSYNPDIVAGVDYRNASITAVNFRGASCYIYDNVNKTSISYTTVGEAHAYWDAKASFRFNANLSNNIRVETSADGAHWSASSYVRLQKTTGISTGFANQGPWFGRQYQVPIEYLWIKTTYRCTYPGNMPPAFYATAYEIRPLQYRVPPGGYVGRMGNYVSDNDGYWRWSASNPAYRAVIAPNTFFAITHGTSITYGSAVTVFGIGISQETIYDSNHEQRIDAGNSHIATHDIWGAKGPVSSAPGTFYSW
jgi:hypothetical protein